MAEAPDSFEAYVLTLFNITLPPGTVLGSGFQLGSGAAIVSSDSITANVVTTPTAGAGR